MTRILLITCLAWISLSDGADSENPLTDQIRKDATVLIEKYPEDMEPFFEDDDVSVDSLVLMIEDDFAELLELSAGEKAMLADGEFPVSAEKSNASREELQRAVGDKPLPAILRYYRTLDEITAEQAMIQFRLCRNYLEN